MEEDLRVHATRVEGARAVGAMLRPWSLSCLVWILFVATLVALLTIYNGPLSFVVAGVSLSSSGLFRPMVIASLALVALSLLHPRWRARRDVLVVLLCWNAYALHFDTAPSGDVVPAEYVALSMVTGRGTSLDHYPELVERGLPYFLRPTPVGLRSNFPLGPALVAWPLFVPAPFSSLPTQELLHRLGRLSAMLLGLSSVWLAIQVARRLDPPIPASWLGLAYGIGTSHWSTSSAALWQHGPGELFVLGAVERLLDTETTASRRLMAAGASLTLAVFTRPAHLISVVVLAALTLYLYRRKAAIAAAASMALAIPLGLYHVETYGNVLGAYGSQTHALGFESLHASLKTAFLLLFSPSRGVFWFEPVVLLTLGLSLWRVGACRRKATLIAGLTGTVAILVLYAHHAPWWGGHSVGPRYMTDALPFWILAVASVGGTGWAASTRGLVASLTVLGFVVNVSAVAPWTGIWNTYPSVDDFPRRLEGFRDSHLLFQLLASAPRQEGLREAILADSREDKVRALSLWTREWASHPWNRFAAYRVADLLLRNGKLDEAEEHWRDLAKRWPDDSYIRHASARIPKALRMFRRTDWVLPVHARASRNGDWAPRVLDGSLGSRWSSEWAQKPTDWLELFADPSVPTRGVALFYPAELSDGPSGLRVLGTTPEGRTLRLGELPRLFAERKGWVLIRFPAVRVQSVRILLIGDSWRRWSVSEARFLAVPGTVRRNAS